MDPVSQGLLGTHYQVHLQKKEIRFASFCGFIGGIAPDIDILIDLTVIHFYSSSIIDISLTPSHLFHLVA